MSTLTRLSDEGVALWLDDLSRERLATGNLEALIREKSVVGVTSNPTIFAKSVGGSEIYDEQVSALARLRMDADEAARLLTTYDVRWACDVLRPAYEVTGGLDGRVSLEVDPRLAHDTQRTLDEVRTLWWLVDRPNLFIKIPATKAGLPAITQALSEGFSINVTLIFGLQRYAEVIDAFMTGLERAKEDGRDLSSIESVASFFVSRVDTEVDKRLDKLGTDQARELRGKAAIANARLAYQKYEEAFAGPRWNALAAAGARPQRPLWASTGVKDPEYDDTRYVVELVTNGVVNTMPEATLQAVADHGVVHGDTVHGSYAEAQEVVDAMERLGIAYDDVVQVLEDEGVEKFANSWKELLATVDGELRRLGGEG